LGENDLQEFGAISHKLNHSIEKKTSTVTLHFRYKLFDQNGISTIGW